MTMWGEIVWGQLLQQDFSSSTTVSTYVNAAAPTNGQFNAISTKCSLAGSIKDKKNQFFGGISKLGGSFFNIREYRAY